MHLTERVFFSLGVNKLADLLKGFSGLISSSPNSECWNQAQGCMRSINIQRVSASIIYDL